MAPGTRCRKTKSAAVWTAQTAADPVLDDTFESVFYSDPGSAAEEDDDSYCEGVGRRRRKYKTPRRKRRCFSSLRAPPLPDISDDDDTLVNLDEAIPQQLPLPAHNKNGTGAETTDGGGPAFIQLEVPPRPTQNVFVLKTADLYAICENTHFSTATLRAVPPHGSETAFPITASRATRPSYDDRSRPGLTNLPAELLHKIYRNVLRVDGPLMFSSRSDFARSAQLLRVCRKIHDEATRILYGENAFHFSRTFCTRGKYYESIWRDVGFQDVRRFLESIGSNISKLRFVSFEFDDAMPTLTPYLSTTERKFVNDGTVLHCLQMLGSQTVLTKFAVAFKGRHAVDANDYHFLKALTSVKSREFSIIDQPFPSKVRDDVVDKIKILVEVPNQEPTKTGSIRVRMYQDRPTRNLFS